MPTATQVLVLNADNRAIIQYLDNPVMTEWTLKDAVYSEPEGWGKRVITKGLADIPGSLCTLYPLVILAQDIRSRKVRADYDSRRLQRAFLRALGYIPPLNERRKLIDLVPEEREFNGILDIATFGNGYTYFTVGTVELPEEEEDMDPDGITKPCAELKRKSREKKETEKRKRRKSKTK